jgi:hypothetical protein
MFFEQGRLQPAIERKQWQAEAYPTNAIHRATSVRRYENFVQYQIARFAGKLVLLRFGEWVLLWAVPGHGERSN